MSNRIAGRRKLPYEIIRKLGSGHFGRVYEGRSPRTGKRVALKVFKNKTDDELVRLELQNNKKVKSLGLHPNIITFLGDYIYGPEKRVVLAFEYAEGGNVLTRLRDMGSFSEADTRDIIRGVFEGLKHLHRHRIMHRDIKPANILLKTRYLPHEPALSDFGVSARLRRGTIPEYFRAGTLPYSPPEALKFSVVGRKGDGWAVGIVMHELLVGKRPFNGSSSDDHEGLVKEILTKRIDFNNEKYRNISSEGRNLMRRLLTKNANHRPTADDALQDPWFSNAPDEKTFTYSSIRSSKQGRAWAAIHAAVSHFRPRRSRSQNGGDVRRRREGSARTKGKSTDWRRVPPRKAKVRMPDRKRSPRRDRSYRS